MNYLYEIKDDNILSNIINSQFYNYNSNRQNLLIMYKQIIMGQVLSSNKQQSQEYILLTYRYNIQPVQKTTYYSSDSGWGCMLRVAQMFIANLLFKFQKLDKIAVVQMFYDNLLVPFSIQNFTLHSKQMYPYMKNYQWFTPCQASFLIKKLVEDYDSQYSVNICNDNCMFLSQISTQRQNIIVLVMARIGLDKPQVGYLNCVLKLMQMPYFNSILGGTPKRAHLFIQHDKQSHQLSYLDPHKTQKTISQFQQISNHLNEYQGVLQWIDERKIDSSMAIAFAFKRQELQSFWVEMEKLKQQLNHNFFIYMDRQKPDFNSLDLDNALIQIDF